MKRRESIPIVAVSSLNGISIGAKFMNSRLSKQHYHQQALNSPHSNSVGGAQLAIRTPALPSTASKGFTGAQVTDAAPTSCASAPEILVGYATGFAFVPRVLQT